MAAKNFKTAPKPKTPAPEQIDAFVNAGTGTDTKEQGRAEEPTKRLSIDLPESLHTRFKVACTKAHSKMVGEIISMIEKRTDELEAETNK